VRWVSLLNLLQAQLHHPSQSRGWDSVIKLLGALLMSQEVLLLLVSDKGVPASWAVYALAFHTSPANFKAAFLKTELVLVAQTPRVKKFS